MLAPAKINLTLEVLARRDDGFHALRSVMVPVALADELHFAPAGAFSFACEPSSLAPDNLVVRAFERLGMANAAVAVSLVKAIPAGAGLGGGSSDAAAVLRAAMNGSFGPPGSRDWVADARALGSDVPFFLADAPAIVEGTGERVTALGAPPPWWVVLVVPTVHVATADAYGLLASARATAPPESRPRNTSVTLRCGEALQRGEFDTVTATMTNDFEEVIADAYPAVRAALDSLRVAGAARPMLSGSGGACFALAPDEAAARALGKRLCAPDGARVEIVPFDRGGTWR